MQAHRTAGAVRIYGTLGPACRDADTLEQMFRAGMTGLRLNLSHAGLAQAAPELETARQAAARCGLTPELLIDLQGPELRMGALAAPLTLTPGQRLSPEELALPAAARAALAEAAPGQELLLDDGRLLLCLETPQSLLVRRGGLLQSRKSLALPGLGLEPPAVTEKDRANLALAAACGVSAVMQPFVRGREDLLQVRRAMEQAGCGGLRLLAKIENLRGVEALEEILPACDELVIARGDLGNSMELWKLPGVQKRISARCRAAGRDFMVVTQMLDSMTHRPVPTRAELSDIFNAVLDGAASVMVTGETASGEYPVETIRYLVRTVREAEAFA